MRSWAVGNWAQAHGGALRGRENSHLRVFPPRAKGAGMFTFHLLLHRLRTAWGHEFSALPPSLCKKLKEIPQLERCRCFLEEAVDVNKTVRCGKGPYGICHRRVPIIWKRGKRMLFIFAYLWKGNQNSRNEVDGRRGRRGTFLLCFFRMKKK